MNRCGNKNPFIDSFPHPGLHAFSSLPFPSLALLSPWRWSPFLLFFIAILQACGPTFEHYEQVEDSLRLENPQNAVEIIEQAKSAYQEDNELLYFMDMGMTLHLAGHYRESNKYLEQADDWIEQQYTQHIHEIAAPLWLNEQAVPYRGDQYEHVIVNVIKALNYALLHDLSGALVEARKIDHRLNLLSDAGGPDHYREDPFARYLTGVLFEASGDVTNAFIAYRKAEAGYRLAKSWSDVSLPSILKQDILRLTSSLHLPEEKEHYRQAFPSISPQDPPPHSMGSVFVVSYNGLSPIKENKLVHVPLSDEDRKFAAIPSNRFRGGTIHNRKRNPRGYAVYKHGSCEDPSVQHPRRSREGMPWIRGRGTTPYEDDRGGTYRTLGYRKSYFEFRERRALRSGECEALGEGLYEKVFKVGLPEIVLRPSHVAYSSIQAIRSDSLYETTTQRVYDVGAAAKKNLDDQLSILKARAAVRGMLKYGTAAGAGILVGTLLSQGPSAPIMALLTTTMASMAVAATEEVDNRIWRTLPGEIHIARLWLEPGEYTINMESFDYEGNILQTSPPQILTVSKGETHFLTQRILD